MAREKKEIIGPDWDLIKIQFETGQYKAAVLAEMHSIPVMSITMKASRNHWKMPFVGAVKQRADAMIAERTEEIVKHLPPLDIEVSPQARLEIEITAEMRSRIIIGQQEHLAKLSTATHDLLLKVSNAISGADPGEEVAVVSKGIVVRKGKSFDFLGERESLTDALNKLAQAASKIIPLTRQAFRIDEANEKIDPISKMMEDISGKKGLVQDGAGDLSIKHTSH